MNLLLRILAFLFGGFVLYAYLKTLGQDHSLSHHIVFCSFILFMFWSVWHLNKSKHIKPADRKPWLSDTASIGREEAKAYLNNWYIRLFLGGRNLIQLSVFLTAFYLFPWDLLYQTSLGGALIEKIRPPSTDHLLQLEFATYAIPFVSAFNALMAISLLLAVVYSNPMPAYIKGRVKSPYAKSISCVLGTAILIVMTLYLLFFNFMQEGSWTRGITHVVKNHQWAFALFIYACWYFCHVLTLFFFCFTKSLFTVRKPPHTLGGNGTALPR